MSHKYNREDKVSLFYSTKELFLRNWTRSIINKLIEPEYTEEYKQYGKRCIAKYYLKTKIEEIESTKEFKTLLKKAAKRSSTQKKSVSKKKRELLRYIKTIKIEILKLSKEDLLFSAIQSYNDYNSQKFTFVPATENSDIEFLNRIQVNYLRHNSQYHEELDNLFGKVGTFDGYLLLKKRILREIGKKYKYLKEETQSQINRLHNELSC